MKIELDAVVNEYVLDTLESEPGTDRPPRVRERAVVKVLATLIEEGLIIHRYDTARAIDEFRATPRLVRRWEVDFPEIGKIASATDTIVVKVGEGNRTFFDSLARHEGRVRHGF